MRVVLSGLDSIHRTAAAMQPETPPTSPGDSPADAATEQRWPHATVLVVDDEPGMRHFLEGALSSRAGQVLCAGSAEEADALLARHRFDLAIVDIALPGRSGIDWLRDLRASANPCEVVLITAFADLETAIQALRAGASDFLLKPFRVTQVLGAFQRGMERSRLRRENWVLRRALRQSRPPAPALVGQSLVIRGLQAALQRYATVDSTVLLTGESGTGKELAALELHRLGPHGDSPFVPVNCAAMSGAQLEAELFGVSASANQPQRDGLFVYAQGGTLFLDEIGELPASAQGALLRAIETRHVRPVGGQQEIPLRLRIVAATNRPLRDDVESGRFRRDLYYRLQVIEIHIPPLRAHKEDIAELVQHFIATLGPTMGLPPFEVTDEELRFLQTYEWPGNVRELRNLIERSLIVGALNVSALYPSQRAGGRQPTVPGANQGSHPATRAHDEPPVSLQELERRHILAVLAGVDGDKSQAAALLGVSRRTLERRMAEWSAGGSAGSGGLGQGTADP